MNTPPPPEEDARKLLREKLKAKLNNKIFEKSIGRSSKKTKECLFYSELKKAGIDVDELKKNIDILSESGAKKQFEATFKKS